MATDPIFDYQAGVVHKVCLVVGDQRHPQGDRVRRDEFVQGITVVIFVGGAYRAIRPGGLCFEGRTRLRFR